jgi:hypothetical protein
MMIRLFAKRKIKRVLVVGFTAMLATGPAANLRAQQASSPTHDIVARASRLKPGTSIKIETFNGRVLKGQFVAVQGPSLLINLSRFSSPPRRQNVIAIDLASITSLQAGWWRVQSKRSLALSAGVVVAWYVVCEGWKRGGPTRCGG